MASSNIIKELVNEEISIKKALYRLLVIASDIEDEGLSDWIEKELNGYSVNDKDIPDYRIVRSSNITYSGLNGSFQVKKLPLPFHYIPEEYRESCFNNLIIDSVDSLEQMSIADGEFMRDLTAFAPMVYKETGIQCFNIQANYSSNTYTDLINIIKTRLLKILLMLEKELGNLDSLDIPRSELTPEKMTLLHDAINVIINDNSVKIGDNNSIEESSFKVGDADGN
ncbi:AbiTii domain-containing protein [Petrocella sp. FN5]|uniref:AbiTii domain-containing protein n=1 Tax=Petrocella sp. FN5 TaxID=3032002 RepID=UPI0023DAEE0D|nr:hypothetical protein [Petrocella sp. FN5]MDF1617982.1 hypothetical protein [Petrocella sp. FN5]